jgi:hypothetical protein
LKIVENFVENLFLEVSLNYLCKMIKFVNSFSIVLLIMTGVLLFFIYHDEMDIQIPYIQEIMLGMAGVFIFLLLLKSNVRWQALFMGLRAKGFNLSLNGFKKIILSELFSTSYFLVFALVVFIYFPTYTYLGWVFLIFFLEGVLHLSFQLIKKPYKVLLNNKNISVVTNNLTMVRWSDILKIETRHKDVHFINKLGYPILVDTQLMSDKDKNTFLFTVQQLAQEKGIYCSVGEIITGERG